MSAPNPQPPDDRYDFHAQAAQGFPVVRIGQPGAGGSAGAGGAGGSMGSASMLQISVGSGQQVLIGGGGGGAAGGSVGNLQTWRSPEEQEALFLKRYGIPPTLDPEHVKKLMEEALAEMAEAEAAAARAAELLAGPDAIPTNWPEQ